MSLSESESSAEAVPVAGVAAVVSVCRRRKGWWWVKAIGFLLLCLFISLAFITNVPTRLSAAGIASMENNLGLKGLPRPLPYEDEIRTVRMVQARVFAKAPFGEGIPAYEPREPSDLMKYGRGLCYDRSRTLDKAANSMAPLSM